MARIAIFIYGLVSYALFLGVYPGLTPAMLGYVEGVFADFFGQVKRQGKAAA